MEYGIVTDSFSAWTSGRDAVASRISIFEHVRNIPYAIVPSLRDPATSPAGLLKLQKGACGAKHFLMVPMLEKMGLSVKYVTETFSWDDPSIKYPPELRALTRKMPITDHLTCRALINDKWVLLDATWDPPLKKAGFPVNENWDGVSDTKSAVTVIKEVVHDSLDERLKFSAALRSAFTAEEKDVYAEFISVLNPWLENLRSA